MSADTDFDFSTVTATPSVEPPADYDPKPDALICQEPGCFTPLTYGGKGRKPTKCDAHKKSRSSGTPRRLSGTSRKSSSVDYRPGIMGLMQLPAGVLAFAGMNKPELAADAATITVYAPGIADALNELAKERPEVAAVLDRVLSVGPYGLVIAAVMPMVLQILANHGVLPAGLMGTVPKEAMLQHMAQQAAAQEEALKAAMAA
jgi:hypothetical protein